MPNEQAAFLIFKSKVAIRANMSNIKYVKYKNLNGGKGIILLHSMQRNGVIKIAKLEERKWTWQMLS